MLADTASGVPLISPVVVLKDSPDGNVGEIDHETTAPPLAVGVRFVIETFFVRVTDPTP